MWHSFDVKAGDELCFRTPVSGCRAYMALSGGIDIPITMGSRSTHVVSKLGGLGRPLVKGDILRVNDINRGRFLPNPTYRFPSEWIPKYMEDWSVRVIAGPQAGRLAGMVGYSAQDRDILVAWLHSLLEPR